MRTWMKACVGLVAFGLIAELAFAQPPAARGPREGRPGVRRGRPGGPGGFGRPVRRGDFPRIRFPLMVALDTNKDGELSAGEIKKATESLKTIDKNNDGKLSPEELRPVFPGREGGPPESGRAVSPEAMLERIMNMDKDGDGKVTKEEAPERMTRFFERGDTDGDGAISKAEAKKLAERIAEMRSRRGGGGRDPRGRPRGGVKEGPPRPVRPDSD